MRHDSSNPAPELLERRSLFLDVTSISLKTTKMSGAETMQALRYKGGICTLERYGLILRHCRLHLEVVCRSTAERHVVKA